MIIALEAIQEAANIIEKFSCQADVVKTQCNIIRKMVQELDEVMNDD